MLYRTTAEEPIREQIIQASKIAKKAIMDQEKMNRTKNGIRSSKEKQETSKIPRKNTTATSNPGQKKQ